MIRALHDGEDLSSQRFLDRPSSIEASRINMNALNTPIRKTHGSCARPAMERPGFAAPRALSQYDWREVFGVAIDRARRIRERSHM